MGILRRLFRNLFAIRPAPSKDEYRPVQRYEPTSDRWAPEKQRSAAPTKPATRTANVERIKGRCYIVDGDTITIGKATIRLAGIDAPEMDQPFGKAAKWALFELCKGQVIIAEMDDHQSYERNVATCRLPDGRDLSAEMVKLGLALDWHKFSGGKYRHLEPEGVRKKLWRVDAKHKGKLPPVRAS